MTYQRRENWKLQEDVGYGHDHCALMTLSKKDNEANTVTLSADDAPSPNKHAESVPLRNKYLRDSLKSAASEKHVNTLQRVFV